MPRREKPKLPDVAQCKVQGEIEVRDHRIVDRTFRDIGHVAGNAGVLAAGSDAGARQDDIAVGHRNESCDRFGERELAIAGHAGDAEDFPRREFEGDVADRAAVLFS